MDNRYFMIDLPETEDAAYARIAEYCDEVELLSEDHSGGVYDQECLWGTELEPLLPALVGEREGSSWGMHGKLYRFRMTEEVAALLKKYGLDSVIRFFGDRYRFENAALYRQGKRVYSCCSHEGLEDWADKAFAASLARLCRREIERSAAYAAARDKLKVLPAKERSADKIGWAFSVFTHFENYVEDDIGVTIHGCYEEECDFPTFRRLANMFLSDATGALLAGAGRFADLAARFEEPCEWTASKTFVTCDVAERPLAGLIRRELNFLELAADGMNIRWRKERDGNPSVIIRE